MRGLLSVISIFDNKSIISNIDIVKENSGRFEVRGPFLAMSGKNCPAAIVTNQAKKRYMKLNKN